MGYQGGSSGRRRTRAAGKFLQSDDAGVARAKREAGADRAGCGLARTGQTLSARIEEPTVPIATDHRESDSRPNAKTGTVRRSVSREFADSAGRACQPESYHW